MSDVLGLDHAVHPWIAESDQRVRFGVGTLGWRAGGELLRLGQNAEQLGFDSYWVQDHPMGGPDCWTSLAALAVTTQRLRLGSIVSCVHYRSPVLLARHAADVDRFSGGRLVLGIGFGHIPRAHAVHLLCRDRYGAAPSQHWQSRRRRRMNREWQAHAQVCCP